MLSLTRLHAGVLLLVLAATQVSAFCEYLDLHSTHFKQAYEGRYSLRKDETTWCDVIKPVYARDSGNSFIFYGAYTDVNNDDWEGWVVGEEACDPSTPVLRAPSTDPAPNVVSPALWTEVEEGVEYQTSMVLDCPECEKGYWSSTCLNECLSCYHGKCNDTDGACICAFGYTGETCKGFSVGVKVALGLCCSVALASVVIIIVCVCRKKARPSPKDVPVQMASKSAKTKQSSKA